MNPYRHLLTKVRSLINAELPLNEDERRANQWVLYVSVYGDSIIVGKGDVNTIFYQFGKTGKRQVCYPMDIVELLKERSAERYFAYVVKSASAEERLVWTLKRALTAPPDAYNEIHGVGENDELSLLYTARKSLTGRVWTPVKGKKK